MNAEPEHVAPGASEGCATSAQDREMKLAAIEASDRLTHGLYLLYKRGDMTEAQREVLLDAMNTVAWDDAIHITAPWDDRVTLCGNWNRNRVPLSDPRPGGMPGCWTCLTTADWLDAHPFKKRDDEQADREPG